MSDYAELIARLEKATGPDRQLDFDIALSVGWTQHWGGATGTSPAGLRDLAGNYHHTAPAYTVSIDAALTLVPAEMDWRVGNETWPEHDEQRSAAVVYVPHTQRNHNTAPTVRSGATPAIALCIASLKARSVQSHKREGGSHG